MANSATVTITTPVVARTSFNEGVVTLRISVRTSLKKPMYWSHRALNQANNALYQVGRLLPPPASLPADIVLLVATFAMSFSFQGSVASDFALALCSRYNHPISEAAGDPGLGARSVLTLSLA